MYFEIILSHLLHNLNLVHPQFTLPLNFRAFARPPFQGTQKCRLTIAASSVPQFWNVTHGPKEPATKPKPPCTSSLVANHIVLLFLAAPLVMRCDKNKIEFQYTTNNSPDLCLIRPTNSCTRRYIYSQAQRAYIVRT